MRDVRVPGPETEERCSEGLPGMVDAGEADRSRDRSLPDREPGAICNFFFVKDPAGVTV